MVIDQLVSRITLGRQTFDRDGVMAAAGKIDPKLLNKLLRDKYLRAKPPKSAGREQYGSEFVGKLLDTELSSEDLIATATALTAESIALGIRNFVMPEMRVDEIFVSGGGVHNPTLLGLLRKAMDPIPVLETTEAGLDVDAKEAVAFAVLAYETHHQRPSNVPQATGAKRSVILGKVTPNGSNRSGSQLESKSGSAEGDSRVTVINGARNGASHKARPTVNNPVKRQPSPAKAKAAVR